MRQITRLLPAALCELRIPHLLTAALVALLIAPVSPWERALDAQAAGSARGARVNFAPRQGEGPVSRLEPSDWAIRGPAREGVYLDAVGLKAAWMGTEQGELEAWVWPWKIMHHFDLLARFDEVGSEIALSPLARTVEVRPYGAQITYVHSRFTIRQTLFAEAADPVLVMLLEVDTSADLTLVASFVPDLAPMWPAGMGGQYAFFDAGLPGYVLSESRRQVNAIIGSPDASRGSSAPAHQLAGAGAFEIPVSRDRAKAGPVVLVITGGMEEREATIGRYRRAAEEGALLLDRRIEEWTDAHPFVDLDLPDESLEAAWRWSVASLVDGYQFAPGLGTGLVAGFGPTGEGFRPGFSWYFGGDTSINSFGLVAAGQGWVLADAFPFLEGHQRDDGKMMHELTRSAPLIDWFGDYPYAFIHGDTTPFYVVALANYVRWTGDLELLERSWPHLQKAHEFGIWADEDADGLMDNSRAGLGASELGSLQEDLKTGVFLATVWTQALDDLAYLASLRGDERAARSYRGERDRAGERLEELFIDPATRTLNFGVSVSGEPKNDRTAWAAFPITFGLLEGEAAANTLDMVASAVITTDWGTRMLSEESPFYDPVGYNNGAVWPFLTGYAAMAEYGAGRRYAGYQHLRQVAQLTWVGARGRHPEVLSGDYFTPLEASVPHQLFSSSPVPANLVRGVLGLDMDLPGRRITVRPQLPGGWRRVALSGYPLPDGRQLDLVLQRRIEGGRSVCELVVEAPPGLLVQLAPQPTPLEHFRREGELEAVIGADGVLRMSVEGTVGIDLLVDTLSWAPAGTADFRSAPREGDPPTGLRIVRVDEQGADAVLLVLEGRAGWRYHLELEGRAVAGVQASAGVDFSVEPGEEGRTLLDFTVEDSSGEPVGVDEYRRFTCLIRVR